MKYSKNRITFKVLIGYIIIGVLAIISSSLIFYEIKNFTKVQKEDFLDRSLIIKTGSLIADIYENESLARASIELNSNKKFNEYVEGNKTLLLQVDSLNNYIEDASQKIIIDSIKFFLDKKLYNIRDLKNLKSKNTSDQSINKAINKLSSIDSVLGKVSIKDLVKNPDALDKKTRQQYEEYVRILQKYNNEESIDKKDQDQIDSIISSSKNMLKKVQRETSSQRLSLQKKEQELIENDLIIFNKLHELLNTLERDIIYQAEQINEQKEQTLNHSKNIILLAALISFIIIIIFSIIVLSDFRKTQRYRKQLEQANATTSSLLKSREQLISMVSHDLRTPLNTILGFSELLQYTALENKEKNYIEHIKSASVYMGQLVDDLLEFSKLENGKIIIQNIPFNLEKTINEIILNTKRYVQDKPINFIVKHDKRIQYSLLSDPFRLKQILYNLVTNACKFTNNGSITIESKLQENQSVLCIYVKDTGIGISDDQKEYIFDAFTQAENDKDQKTKGFGLGLTISKKLAELLGGSLVLESELNKGSTFIVKIPVKLTDKPLSTSSKTILPTNFNVKAVVIEDDPVMLQLLNDSLKQFGVFVYAFNNAQQALSEIEFIEYDVILTDIQLPKMNGFHFMESLINTSFYKQQPIIAMTGRATMVVKDYIDSGFKDVLFKPFKTEDIQRVFKSCFSNAIKAQATTNLSSGLKETNGFNLKLLASFYNGDREEINKALRLFLKETQSNFKILETAFQNKNISEINNISHKMLGMFKQLQVEELIPYLETFEETTIINNKDFKTFTTKLNTFIQVLDNYLS